MPVKTVTLNVVAATDSANRAIRATGAYFDELRAKNPVELTVKLNRLQAIAESKILAKEMATTVNDTLKLDLEGGGTGGIGGIIARLFAGGSGPGKGLPGPLGSLGGVGPVPPIGELPPAVAGPGAVAVLAGIPLLAQAAAGAITFGLGAALTGIGVYAEKGVKSVTDQFAGLQADVSKTFTNLSPAFGEALATILSAARTFVPQFIRDFKPALDAIAGPLKSLGVEIAASLAKPEVADSLKAVGTAFGGILKALTPAIPGIVTAVADGFTNIANAVSRNPKAFADFAIALGHIAGIALDVIAWLTQIAVYLESHWKDVLFGVAAGVVDHWRGLWTFFQELAAFFTRTLPLAFDIFKESVRITFDQVQIFGLRAALGITVAFGHLPGALGKPFRDASAAIRGDLAAVQGDVTNAVNNITADWNKLNGVKANLYVYTNFVNVGSPSPVGGIFPTPSGLPPGVVKKHAAGTASAAPGWAWVGEAGAELVRFQGGETVLSAAQSARVAGYARGTGWGGTANVTITVEGTPRNEVDAMVVSLLKRLIATGHLNVAMVP